MPHHANSGSFRKGRIGWNKGKHGVQKPYWLGKKRSLEDRKKMSDALKKKPRRYWLGKKRPPFSKETRLKMSIAKKGKKIPWFVGRTPWNMGLKGFLGKEKHWHWKGGITSAHGTIRASGDYKRWREAVYKRDDFTCQMCRKRGGKLNADHIKPFAYFPELRFTLSNGRTLCVRCHKNTPTYRKKESKKDLINNQK